MQLHKAIWERLVGLRYEHTMRSQQLKLRPSAVNLIVVSSSPIVADWPGLPHKGGQHCKATKPQKQEQVEYQIKLHFILSHIT